MIRTIRNLMFVATIGVWLLAGSPGLQAYSEDWCSCFTDGRPQAYVYFYEQPNWVFITQWQYQVGFYLANDPNGDAQECHILCDGYAFDVAKQMCQTYGEANHSVQVDFFWHFEDYDFDHGGSDTGSESIGGFSPIMCSAL